MKETFTKQDLSGGTLYDKVSDNDIANNPKAMANITIDRQNLRTRGFLVGFTQEQIDFLLDTFKTNPHESK